MAGEPGAECRTNTISSILVSGTKITAGVNLVQSGTVQCGTASCGSNPVTINPGSSVIQISNGGKVNIKA